MNGIYTPSRQDHGQGLRSNEYTTTVLVYAFAPGGGAFVIGDQTATGGVTFWGSKWAKLNKLSGWERAFRLQRLRAIPTTPACGVNWSTDPGTAPRPPADRCLLTWL